MKTTLLALSLVAALPLAAQTPHPHPTASTTTHPHTALHASGGCITPPAISEKVPALPSGSPCVKALYTLTRTPDVKLDYVSPLISPELRAGLAPAPGTFSLLYVDTKVGTGELLQPHKWLSVHYTGYLPDGTKFDSSLDRGEPISFPYGQGRVIPGWDTGFEGMHIGGKRRLYIPYELAYGEKGRPPVIPAKSELIFDMELVSQSDEQPKPKAPPAPPAPAPKPATPPPPASPAGTTAPPPTTSDTPAATTAKPTPPATSPKQ